MEPQAEASLVSVIVPAYNAAPYIERTLRSAMAQTHTALEIVVVDDGSHDGTAAIVRRLQEEDVRIALIEQRNGGVASARNAAFRQTRGALIAPLDADDLWHPTKIARQVARFAADPEAGMVYCWSADIDTHDIVSERRLDVARFEGDVLAPMLVANFIDTSSAPLLRRDAIIAAGGWDETLRACDAQGCEDWMLYMKVAARMPVLLEPAFLVGYRQLPDAMSRDIGRMRRSMLLVHEQAERMLGRVPAWIRRFSLAQFEHYVADMLRSEGRLTRSFWQRAKAIANEPAWLVSRTARRRLRGWLTRQPAYAPVGGGTLPFAELEPDVARFPAPDRWTRRRNARLSAATLASFRG